MLYKQKSRKFIRKFENLSAPNAKVIRDNKNDNSSKNLVVGDIVFLEAGDYIPADGRLIEAQSLKVVEGMLTGESEPVLKHTEK